MISDRFGANRHYQPHRPDALHIACEIKTLAALAGRTEIDPAGLASMLSFGYHLGDLTILRDVKCLSYTRHLEYLAPIDVLKIERYWNYPYGNLEPKSVTATCAGGGCAADGRPVGSRIRATEQASSLLPPALFMQALEQAPGSSDEPAGVMESSAC